MENTSKTVSYPIKSFIQSMPKLDLHCHIDGSFGMDFVRSVLNPDMTEDTLRSHLQAPPDCASLTEYLTCFDLPIRCMQTAENITNGILNILKNCVKENVKYIELRFAPTCSVNEHLRYADVYEAAIKGCRLGKEMYGIFSNIIICAMRHHELKDNLAMLHAAMDYIGHGICALDLAGDENAHGNLEFAELFAEARRLSIPFTIHSGECGSTENVRLAIEYGARRIGHGIALMHDKELAKLCREKRIGLELCPTSNYQTHAVADNQTYPLRLFLDWGLCATVNTDNRTVSNTDLIKEYSLICDRFGICEEDLITMYKNSVEASFADDTVRHQLLKLL